MYFILTVNMAEDRPAKIMPLINPSVGRSDSIVDAKMTLHAPVNA